MAWTAGYIEAHACKLASIVRSRAPHFIYCRRMRSAHILYAYIVVAIYSRHYYLYVGRPEDACICTLARHSHDIYISIDRSGRIYTCSIYILLVLVRTPYVLLVVRSTRVVRIN